MLFDKPAGTTNPIDQLKVDRPPHRPHRRSLTRSPASAPYAYERFHDIAPNPAYGAVVGAAHRQGPDRVDGPRPPPRARQAFIAIVTAENAGPLGKGKFNTAKLLGGPEIEHYHQAVADRGGGDLRAGPRGRGPRSRWNMSPAEGAFNLAETTAEAASRTRWATNRADTAISETSMTGFQDGADSNWTRPTPPPITPTP